MMHLRKYNWHESSDVAIVMDVWKMYIPSVVFIWNTSPIENLKIYIDLNLIHPKKESHKSTNLHGFMNNQCIIDFQIKLFSKSYIWHISSNGTL